MVETPIRQKLLLRKPIDSLLMGAVQKFLLPRLTTSLLVNGYLADEEAHNSVPVFTSPFDSRFLFGEQIAGALWTGYTESQIKFLSAQDEVASFWLVPSAGANDSLLYFKGTLGKWTPQSMVLPIMQESNSVPTLTEEEAKFENELNSRTTLSLWIDFDGDENYRAKVVAFLRLFNAMYAQDKNRELELCFLLLNITGRRINLDDWGLGNSEIPIVITTNEDVLYYYADYYYSLAITPTVYDPLVAAIHNSDNIHTCVYAPMRMDTVNLLNVRELNPMLAKIITALISHGSTGVGPMLKPMGDIYDETIRIFVQDLVNQVMPGTQVTTSEEN